LRPGSGEDGANGGKVLRIIPGSKASRYLLPDLHHSRALPGQVIDEWHGRVGQNAKHILFAGEATPQQILAHSPQGPATLAGLSHRGLRLVKRQSRDEVGIVATRDQGDQARL